MYACIAERDAADDGATMIVCASCGKANFVDWFLIDHPLGWRALWHEVAPLPDGERSGGARLTILAGPSSDIVALALVCLDNQEPRVVARVERYHDEIDTFCLRVRNDEKLRKTRDRLRRREVAEIRSRFASTRLKVGASQKTSL